MLTAFALQGGRLEQLGEIGPGSLEQACWVDLASPTDEELQTVERLYQQPLPDIEEADEIEASARSFEDENGLHLHSTFLREVEGRPTNTNVAFTLSDGRLFTLHEHALPIFRLVRLRARREPGLIDSAVSLLLALFEVKVENLADRLEQVHKALEQVSADVLAEGNAEMGPAIDALTYQEDINGKIRLALMDTQRDLLFLIRRGRLQDDDRAWAREILGDVESLFPHNAFIFDKINFLMDAAVSFINIQQNQIIKIFSIAAVVFLPPTLVASIYGMNFQHMPELEWLLGYPMALVLMIASGVAPYAYFKRKGWL